MKFVDFDICHQMVLLQKFYKFYFATLTYLLKVINFKL